MREIPLTKGMVAIVDDDDYAELSQFKWHYNSGYAVRGINRGRQKVLMHRYINKTPDGMETDHINGNKLDNRKENLRAVNSSQNNINKAMQKNNTSGTRGVFWHKATKRWVSSIGLNGKSVHIGYFKDKAEAETAYQNAAQSLHGEYARAGAA